VERWNGESGVGFLALDQGTACGLAGSFLDQKDATRAHLLSMWTASTHRQQGIGRLIHLSGQYGGRVEATLARILIARITL
jgi:hypothetical protein